ncbi:beta-aspartyl-peptidase [Tissierella sp. MSJ-40]|uniref:Isoaspartyl dipeptidase n=1 Tax=Tissierella simiarum TaxID=2841534 RepID=A0ABS6E3R3_9FIRM|nr:beta-aspartyl-peptidase [Tissierella simiarum]MBU5436898.1 beta-aspartyl-peptidase [Tissierella simiarum]
MIKIIKEVKVYAPEYLGIKDVVLVGNKICSIGDNLEVTQNNAVAVDIIHGKGKILTPGFIDNHVHIIGGGGEGGFRTRTPEIKLTDITTAGITTVVGCLGTDGITRNMMSLLAKARSLEEDGITTFIYSGSYRIPVTTITGDVSKDLIAIDKVIGVGEIAISDHRSSQPTIDELKKLAADARVSGILSGKAGIVNIHVGDGDSMIDVLTEIVENTEIPYTQFIPTHMNRNARLFEAAIKYAKSGGFIDFTTSSDPVFWEEGEVKVSKGLKKCYEAGVSENNITLSSDGQGSLPMFNENKEFAGLQVGKVSSLFEEIRDAVIDENLPLEKVLKTVTSNPATLLKLNGKGRIKEGYDADVVLLNEKDLTIHTVIAKGQIVVENKEIKVFGTFE